MSHPQLLASALLLLVPIAFGFVSLAMGMDANWDLRNYHYYNAWAWAEGQLGRDFLVAHVASFYNPTLDLPFYYATKYLPAKGVGFLLGVAHGLNFNLLFGIARRTLRTRGETASVLASAAVALAGVVGGGALGLIGTTFWDNLASLLLLGSALLVIHHHPRLLHGPLLPAALLALAAGLPAGLGFGLKQPAVYLCIGLCFSIPLMPGPLWRKLQVAFWYGIGVIAGFLLGAGHWMAYLYATYGNPLFPHFNHLFKAPLALEWSYNNTWFVPQGLAAKLAFPFRFSGDMKLVGEASYSDYRVLAAYLLLPLAGLAALGRWWRARRGGGGGHEGLSHPWASAYLLTSMALGYTVWLVMFSIYRYLVPLEMLAPLAVVVAVGLLPLPLRLRWAAGLGLVALLVVSARLPDWERAEWSERWVESRLPEGMIRDPQRTLVVMTGLAAGAYVIPAFPEQTRVVRIESYIARPGEAVGFNQVIRERIASHQGDLLLLVWQFELEGAAAPLAHYGLRFDPAGCRDIRSSIDKWGPWKLCPVERQG